MSLKHLFKKAPKKLILHVSHHLFIASHVVNFWCYVNKLHEKQQYTHHTPMLSNSYSLQCNHLCSHSIMAIIKIRTIIIMCLCSSIVCNKIFFFKTIFSSNHEKKKKKKNQKKTNPLTCQSHIFYVRPSNWTPHL
jgi:dipeptide/tripeptide permease